MKLSVKILAFLITLVTLSSNAQTILEKYIKEGIENNIVLQQKKVSYDAAVYSLKTATSYFFPSVYLNASYTSGEGGRSLALPVGDLLNPVYQTLNQLTGSNSFPQIDNVNESLLPDKFYDVKIRTSMPLINPDLIFNRNIRRDQLQIADYEIQLYKRELIKEIKVAYFNYLSAHASIDIYDNALTLAYEGKRVNESLLNNGSGLAVYVLRSESEIEDIKTKKTEAENQVLSAKYYFNFLLNRKLDDEIDSDPSLEDELPQPSANRNYEQLLSGREELQILWKGIEINKSLVSMNRHFWIPRVSAFIDLGVQDQKWNYSAKSKYYLFGIQLEMPVFEFFRNDYKIEQSKLELKNAEKNYQLVLNRLSLDASVASNGLTTAYQNYNSSLKQYTASQSYYKLITRGFQEGANTFLETVDARTQLLNSELSLNITKYKIMIANANYEREVNSSNVKY